MNKVSRGKTGTIQGFGERLDRLIYDRNLNCAELGRRIGKDRKSVYTYRNGEAMPDGVVICRMCTALQTTPNYLLWGKE